MKHIIVSLAALCYGVALAQSFPGPAASQPQTPPQPEVYPANPAFPAPPGLSTKQIETWNFWTSRPEFKSISIIQLDPSIRQSNSIALNVGGKAYVINGKWTRYEGAPMSRNGVPTGERTPGGYRWVSEVIGRDGTGSLNFSDAGDVLGHFQLRGIGNLHVVSREGAVYVVGVSDGKPMLRPNPEPTPAERPASGVQK